MEDGKSLGSLCVIDSDVREWTEVEIKIMKELATIITKEFDTRANVISRKSPQEDLANLQRRIKKFLTTIDVSDTKDNNLKVIHHQKRKFDLV